MVYLQASSGPQSNPAERSSHATPRSSFAWSPAANIESSACYLGFKPLIAIARVSSAQATSSGGPLGNIDWPNVTEEVAL